MDGGELFWWVSARFEVWEAGGLSEDWVFVYGFSMLAVNMVLDFGGLIT